MKITNKFNKMHFNLVSLREVFNSLSYFLSKNDYTILPAGAVITSDGEFAPTYFIFLDDAKVGEIVVTKLGDCLYLAEFRFRSPTEIDIKIEHFVPANLHEQLEGDVLNSPLETTRGYPTLVRDNHLIKINYLSEGKSV